MANNIQLIKNYGAEQLDEEFVKASKTSILEGNNNLLKFVNANTVMIPDITMSGLGDYSRSTGFPDGDVNITWTAYPLTMDRGRSFTVDAMDDEETAGLAFGKLATEFLRTKVVPEVDAYRLSKLFAKAKSGNVVEETLSESNVITRFNEDDKKFEDDEIDHESVVRFISTDVDNLIKNSTELTKHISQVEYASDAGISFKVKAYDDVPLVVVPKGRFYTEYTFGANGFTKKDTAKELNFLSVAKNSAIPVKKHEKIRVFSPDVNQTADAWKFQYRLYHDIFTTKNKVDGIHASHKA